MFAWPPTLNLLSFKRKTELVKQNLNYGPQHFFFLFFCLQGAMNEREANKGTIAAMVWLCVCVVPQQGRVRRDFWERRGGGRVLDPAKLTETVETNASVCVTASVVSAVWLQVTICMCVCVCPQLLCEHHCGAQPLKVFVCMCVYPAVPTHILCVCFSLKIK